MTCYPTAVEQVERVIKVESVMPGGRVVGMRFRGEVTMLSQNEAALFFRNVADAIAGGAW